MLENTVKIKKLYEDAKLPVRKHVTDAGIDLHSYEDVLLKAYNPEDPVEPHRALIRTGLAFEIPPETGLFLWDRSGLAAKDGIHRVAGVVDESYRGELKVALVNLSNKDYQIKKGERIIQAVIQPVILADIVEVKEISNTARSDGGFGSTGK